MKSNIFSRRCLKKMGENSGVASVAFVFMLVWFLALGGTNKTAVAIILFVIFFLIALQWIIFIILK